MLKTLQIFTRCPHAILAQILFSSLALSYAQVQAQTSENPHGENFRERCRKYISGAFTDSYNENLRAQDSAKLAEKTIKRLTPQLNLYNLELAKLEKKMKVENYDPALMERRDQIIAQIRLYHDQVASQTDIAAIAKKTAASAQQTFKSIDSDVRLIFDVSFTDDPDGSSRKIFHQLTWKSPCPKFRSLCPLPAKDAAVLKTLAKKTGDSDGDCQKYSALK